MGFILLVQLLPLDLTATTLVVATAEPFLLDWESEIAKISRRKIQLVISNPLDIAQYIGQFFSLAKSIKSANKANGQDLALRNNFEQRSCRKAALGLLATSQWLLAP